MLCAISLGFGCSPAAPAENVSSSGHTGGVASGGPGAGANSSKSADSRSFDEGPHPLVDEREPDPEGALPRLTYEHLGMHIGGESNSPESKRPWLEDIERKEDALLSCFRLVTDPEKSGSYGVDLYVGREGGAPEVRGSRQKLGEDDFDQCMKTAFASIDFHRPERPTVFSYSIFFRLEDIE